MSKSTVGLIGIGLLGSAVAERLLRAGFRVVGFDVEPDRRQVLIDLGGFATHGVCEVAAHSRRLVLSLPDSKIGADVAEDLRTYLQADSTIVDMTTGDPDEMQQTAVGLAMHRIGYLDATVAGSSEMVRGGEAIIMVGGDGQAFDACSDILHSIAARCFHVGPTGHGAKMKLVANLVMGLNRAALAEGLFFARALGLDGEQVLAILKATVAYSRVMDVKGRKMLEEDFAPQARLSQHRKDVRLMLENARRNGVALPLSEKHLDLLNSAVAAGFGDADNSAVIKVWEKLAKRDCKS